jgi:hypothetical protein
MNNIKKKLLSFYTIRNITVFSIVIFLFVLVCFVLNYYFYKSAYVDQTCLIDEFIRLAKQTDNSTISESCYGYACLYSARIGNLDNIRKFSPKANPQLVTESYRQLIQKMIFDNKINEALQIALSIDDPTTSYLCLTTIQRRYLIIGNYDQAFDIAKKILKENLEILMRKIFSEEPEIFIEFKNILIVVYTLLAESFLKSEKISILALTCENLFPRQDIESMLEKDENEISEITKSILSLDNKVQSTYIYEDKPIW